MIENSVKIDILSILNQGLVISSQKLKLSLLWSFMMSNTLNVKVHILLVNKSLQFNLYRIHTIPVVHPILKKVFKYSIQEEYCAIRSDSQDISFPLSTNKMACQVLNSQFCCINSFLCTADTLNSCSYALFL